MQVKLPKIFKLLIKYSEYGGTVEFAWMARESGTDDLNANTRLKMFLIKALAKVYGKLAAVLDLPPIIYSRFFPRVYLSSRRDVSFPLHSIAETDALCSHGSTHAVCT